MDTSSYGNLRSVDKISQFISLALIPVITSSEDLFTSPSRQNELNKKTNSLPFSYISHFNVIIWPLCLVDESVTLNLFNSDSLSL